MDNEKVYVVPTAAAVTGKYKEYENCSFRKTSKLFSCLSGNKNSKVPEKQENSTVSNNGVCNDKTASNESMMDIPEGGWGWVVVLSSFLIHFIVVGLDRSAGIMYLKFEERFHTSASITAWIPSSRTGLRLTLGPVVGGLCSRFSYRSIVMVGGVFEIASAILSGYAENIYVLFFTYSFLGGIGHALTYTPGVVAINQYFTKKRGTAVGIGTSGNGIGMLIMPLLLEASFEYYGFTGAFFIIGCLATELIVCGALIRPGHVHRKILDVQKKEDLQIRTQFTVYSVTVPDSTSQVLQQQNCTTKDSKIDLSLTEHVHNARKTSSDSVDDEGHSEQRPKEDKTTTKTDYLSLIKNLRFNAFSIGIMVFTLAYMSGMVFIPPYAVQIGASEYEAAYTIVFIGISEFVGRITSGILFDRKCIGPYKIHVYSVLMISLGILCIVFPYIKDYTLVLVICGIFGLLIGMCKSQESVVIVDFVGVQQLSQAFGILLFFQGVGVFVGPPLSGILKDINGTYDYGFYFGGVGVFFGASFLIGANLVYSLQTERKTDTKL